MSRTPVFVAEKPGIREYIPSAPLLEAQVCRTLLAMLISFRFAAYPRNRFNIN
jgi:hypothetical protein